MAASLGTSELDGPDEGRNPRWLHPGYHYWHRHPRHLSRDHPEGLHSSGNPPGTSLPVRESALAALDWSLMLHNSSPLGIFCALRWCWGPPAMEATTSLASASHRATYCRSVQAAQAIVDAAPCQHTFPVLSPSPCHPSPGCTDTQGIEWSTETVYASTSSNALAAGMSVAPPTELPKLQDVDYLEVCTRISPLTAAPSTACFTPLRLPTIPPVPGRTWPTGCGAHAQQILKPHKTTRCCR